MNYTKSSSLKILTVNQKIDPALMTMINSYALRELIPDEVYFRRLIVCHNGIDRDNERFSEGILEDFERTLPGKCVLLSHDRHDLPKGLFFKAFTDTMSAEGFRLLSGESIRLPDNVSLVKVLFGLVYFLRTNFNEELLSLIDGGIARHVSIGFRAGGLDAVKGPYDQILYHEYSSPGEALEGSIVWLGSQPGATIKSPGQAQSTKEKTGFKDWRKKNPLSPLTLTEKIAELKRKHQEAKRRNPLTPDKDFRRLFYA